MGWPRYFETCCPFLLSLQPNTEAFFSHWILLVQISPLGQRSSQEMKTIHFLWGKLWPRVFWPIRGDLFWFWFFGIDIIGIDIIVRTFITSQNKQKIEILWKFKVKFSHWKCFSIWLHAKKRIKIIIPWKLSFKGRKCFKDNHFIVRLPSFRSTCIFYTEIMR